MANAWGLSWGGDTGAWLTSWTTSGAPVTPTEQATTPIRVAIPSPDQLAQRGKALPPELERQAAEKRIAKRVAKATGADVDAVAQIVARVEGVLLATDQGAAMALAATTDHLYDPDEIKRIRAYWSAVQENVENMIEEEDILWLLN